MATQSYLPHLSFSHAGFRGSQPSLFKPCNFGFGDWRSSKYRRKNVNGNSQVMQCCSRYTEAGASFHATATKNSLYSHSSTDSMKKLVLADLDPATAKLAIGFLGPFLSVFGFLFILRIVMSWYPKLPVGKFPYVIVYAPTEPLLVATRKVIPPLAGVDVTPVVWFGLISFLNEILVGPQGLLVLLSQQVN